jgi:hypothetical protein
MSRADRQAKWSRESDSFAILVESSVHCNPGSRMLAVAVAVRLYPEVRGRCRVLSFAVFTTISNPSRMKKLASVIW